MRTNKSWAVTFRARLTLSPTELADLADTVAWRNAEVTYLGESETVQVTARIAAADATTALLDITAAVGAWMNLCGRRLHHASVEVVQVAARAELAARVAVWPAPNLPQVLPDTGGRHSVRIVNAGQPALGAQLVDPLPGDVEDGRSLGVGAPFPVVADR